MFRIIFGASRTKRASSRSGDDRGIVEGGPIRGPGKGEKCVQSLPVNTRQFAGDAYLDILDLCEII